MSRNCHIHLTGPSAKEYKLRSSGVLPNNDNNDDNNKQNVQGISGFGRFFVAATWAFTA